MRKDPGEGGRNRACRVARDRLARTGPWLEVRLELLLADRGRIFRMTFNPSRRVGALKSYIAIFFLVLATLGSSITPAFSATAPKIVSVDVTGNLHVPTQTIMSVVA